jgi:hypothetical protein
MKIQSKLMHEQWKSEIEIEHAMAFIKIESV